MNDTILIENQLRQGLGLHIGQLVPIQIKPEGNSVWQGLLDYKPVIVRMAGGRNALAAERWVYGKLKDVSIPCPEVLAYTEQLPGLDLPCLVMTKVAGVKLNDSPEENQQKLYFKLGTLLKRLHSIEIEGYGELIQSSSSYRGKSNSWTEHWSSDEYLEDLDYCLKHDLLNRAEVDLLKTNFERIKKYSLSKGVLLHGDLSGDNTLVAGHEIGGIIDVEGAMSGDHWFDIGTSFVWFDNSQRKSFIAGYGDYNQEMIYSYLLWVLSFKLAWRHQHQKFNGVKKARKVLDETLNYTTLF